MNAKRILKETQAIWNHKEADETMCLKRSKLQHIIAVGCLSLSFAVLVATLIAFVAYPVTRLQYESMIFCSLLLYVPVWISGSLHQDHIGGSLRMTGLLALFCQIPYTLLFDTIQPNPVWLLFVLALLSRFGISYFLLFLLASWMTSLISPLNLWVDAGGISTGVAGLLLCCILLLPVLLTRWMKGSIQRDLRCSGTHRKSPTWPFLYGVVTILTMLVVYL